MMYRAALAGGIVALLGISACSTSHHPGSLQAGAAPTPVRSALPTAEASILADALTSGDVTTAKSVLAPAVTDAINSATGPLVPTGDTISVESAQMLVTGNIATVPVVLSGSQPGQFLLLLTKVNGSWLVYGTRQTG